MATTTERLALLITADGKGAIRELDAVGKSATKNLGGVEAQSKRSAGALIAMGAGATVAGATILRSLDGVAKGAQDTADSVDLAAATFGSLASSGLDQWATKAASSLGLSREAALDAASAYGTLLKGAGVIGPDLAKKSEQLAGITVDLAERFKLDPKDVQDKIATALKGAKGAKALLSLGIDVSDVKLNEEAIRQHLIKAGDKLTREQKVKVAADIILRSPAAGEFQRSVDSGDIKAQAEVAKAEWKNAMDEIGRAAIPVFSKIASTAATIGHAIEASGLAGPLGTLAAYGAAGTVAVGAITSVVGAVGKLGQLGGAAVETIGALSAKFGGAAVAATGLATAEGAAAVAVEAEGVAATTAVTETEALATAQNTAAVSAKGLAGAMGLVALGVVGAVSAYKGWQDIRSREAGAQLPNDTDFSKALDPADKGVGRSSLFNVLANPITGRAKPHQASFEDPITGVRVEIPGTEVSGKDQQDAASKWLADHVKAIADPTKAREFIDSYRQFLQSQNYANDEITAGLKPATEAVDELERQARIAGLSVDKVGTSGEDAARKIATLGDALAAVKSGEIDASKVDTLSIANHEVDVLQALVDANDKVTEAEKRRAEAAGKDSKRIADAYQTVVDAKKRLFDAEHPDDGSFGLKHTTAAQEIADAEQRLAKANERLSRNPNDAKGNTDKDLALSDLETAKRRRQDEIRNARNQAEQVASARKDLKDAESNYADELANPHKELQAATRDYEQAVRDRFRAEAEFGQLAAGAKDGLKGIKDDLDQMAAAGIIPQSLVDEFKSSIDKLGQSALDAYKKLSSLTDQTGQAPGGKPLGPVGQTPTGPTGPGPYKPGYKPYDPTGKPLPNEPRPNATPPAPKNPKGPLPPSVSTSDQAGLDRAGLGKYNASFIQQAALSGQMAPNTEVVGNGGFHYRYDAGAQRWVPHYARGTSRVPGVGSGDTVPAWLTPKESVLTVQATEGIGRDLIDRWNAGDLSMFAKAQKFATGGVVARSVTAARPYTSSTRDTDRPSVTFSPTIIQHVPEPELAGAAVVTALRGVASRSGRGIRVT